ncbi:hypothetical protein H7347_03810 [Corynebacterium sp. zg-331]|uniref:6PGD fold domain-containing protein n=1 Tax=unclassified Corynebacterium TaxID=2624378 RepID=UPI00128D1E57|nr:MULTISPECIES: hypothetical protein [unclassified Corynebacterium]MBC3185706.1 hypothetical protein [Corynebacterium sp. zg-331]MPV52199.1 hypothetical protein [Corynebacterium sp. zg331]
MKPPRMRVGVWPGREQSGAWRVAEYIAQGLGRAGHALTRLAPTEEGAARAEALQAILLGVGERELPGAVTLVEPHLRPHHIVFHVLPGASLEPLAPATRAGAVVGSLVPLSPGWWAVDYGDELAKTVLELLARELGGKAVLVPGERRLALATGLSWYRFARDVQEEADRALRAALEGSAEAAEWVARVPSSISVLADAPELDRQLSGIVDPGRARLFAQLARRAAERDGREEVELWAMQEDKP